MISINYSPEFTEFGPEALKACIDDGAAKVTGLLSKDSIARVQEKGGTQDLGVLTSRVPEVRSIVSYITDANTYGEMVVNCSSNSHPAKGVEDHEYGHVDGGIAGCGLSMLLPISGAPAFFGADEDDFVLFGRDESAAPSLIWEYGVGDVIFLRQALASVNGRWLEKEPIIHCGMSGTSRELQIVDFIVADITLPGVTV